MVKLAIILHEEGVRLEGMPVPCTSNKFFNKRNWPSKEKQAYLKEFNWWVGKIQKIESMWRIRRFLLGDVHSRFNDRTDLRVINVDYVWVDDFITKDGAKMRMKDSSNRIKAVEDCVSRWMRIDDCYFKNLSIRCIHSREVQDFVMNISKPKPLDRLEGEG